MDHNRSSSLPWNNVPQPYRTRPANDHPQNGYSSPAPMAPVHSTSPTSLHTTYDNTNHTQPQYPAYYNTSSNYPPNQPANNEQIYPSISPMNYAQPYHSQTTPRPQFPVPQASYPHAYSNSYSQSSSLSNPPMSRLQLQTHPYGFPSSAEQPHPTIPIPQTIGISSDYSTSPGRPHSCDLCALSFNRQHDLKRHRETHTGEKPYLCNGGCGKTFTRKDALKRHQLVKSCGQVEDTWSQGP